MIHAPLYLLCHDSGTRRLLSFPKPIGQLYRALRTHRTPNTDSHIVPYLRAFKICQTAKTHKSVMPNPRKPWTFRIIPSEHVDMLCRAHRARCTVLWTFISCPQIIQTCFGVPSEPINPLRHTLWTQRPISHCPLNRAHWTLKSPSELITRIGLNVHFQQRETVHQSKRRANWLDWMCPALPINVTNFCRVHR